MSVADQTLSLLTVEQVYNLLASSSNVMVLDARPSKESERAASLVLSVPLESCTAAAMGSAVPDFRCNDEDRITLVCYDTSSTSVQEFLGALSPDHSKALEILRGSPAGRSNSLAVLQGGISAWVRAFPSLVKLSLNSFGGYQLPSMIVDGFLFLGGAECVTEQTQRSLGLTHVVCMATEIRRNLPKLDVECWAPPKALLDFPGVDLSVHFEATAKFIEEAREKGGRVLVHCSAGISRSPAIVMAWLMTTRGWTLAKAFEYVKERRQQVAPNTGFMKQLLALEKERGLSAEPSMSLRDYKSKW